MYVMQCSNNNFFMLNFIALIEHLKLVIGFQFL